MRRTLLSLVCVSALACAKPPEQQAQEQAEAKAAAEAKAKEEPPEWKPTRRKPEVVRTDLVASDLPSPPTLDEFEPDVTATGSFDYPEGTDEIAPRAVVELGKGGLGLVGQVYFQRRPGRPPETWRWIGFAPESGVATSTKLGPGAIRAAIPSADGGALVVGSRVGSEKARGWFAQLDASATVTLERDLDSPSLTEMFALVPGVASQAGELAVVGGYVDAQGWLVSISEAGERRWHKFLGSYGYTQIRGLARLDGESGDLFAIGARSETFGESWAARVPGDGGPDASPEGAAQFKVEVAGSDPHQMLEALVDLGAGGFVALGTAKRNFIQAHAQVIAVGFDREGKQTWSRVVPELRATSIVGGEARDGVARFVIGVPLDAEAERSALALLELKPGAEGEVVTRQIVDTSERSAAPMAGGVLVYGQTKTGIAWRRASL